MSSPPSTAPQTPDEQARERQAQEAFDLPATPATPAAPEEEDNSYLSQPNRSVTTTPISPYSPVAETPALPPVSTLGPLEDENVSPLTDAARAALANHQLQMANLYDAQKNQQDQLNVLLDSIAAGLPSNAPLAASQFQAANVYDAQKNQQDQLNVLLDSIVAGLPSNAPATSAPSAAAPSTPASTSTPSAAAPSTPATPSQPKDMSSTSYSKGPSDSTPDSSGSGSDNGTGGGSETPYITTVAPAAYTPTATTTPTTSAAAQDAILRKYLGYGSDLYRYGMGPERKYYSAEGGFFDADKYFADGGLVAPAQPPATSTAPPYPTMAFTDGGGAVGSIAQPPGMVASDAFGSDAPHASPMAPSIAASVPTVQPALQTLASRNTNASPAPSPISQNPNVGYSFGLSPLSQL